MFRPTALILSFTSPYLVRSLVPQSKSSISKTWSFRQAPRRIRNSTCRRNASRIPETLECNNLHLLVTNAVISQPNRLGAVLHATIRLFQFYQAPEPLQSACHIVAFALQENNEIHEKAIRWEDNLFSHLLQNVESAYSFPDSTAHSDLEAFLLSTPNLPPMPIFHRKLTLNQVNHVISMILRRIQKEPLQYIFEQWDFYDFTIKIRSPCLCPRPETEELVDLVSQDIKSMIRMLSYKSRRKIRVLDVGAGTGAIGIA